MDSHESNPAGGIIAVDPAVTPLRWKLAPKAMPSKGKMVKNAAKAVGDNLASLMKGNRLASEDAEKRRAICEDCEYQKGGRCLQCGCVLKVKTWLKASSCPVGRW